MKACPVLGEVYSHIERIGWKKEAGSQGKSYRNNGFLLI